MTNLITVINGTKSKTISCESQEDLFKNIQDAIDADLQYVVYEAKVILTNVKLVDKKD